MGWGAIDAKAVVPRKVEERFTTFLTAIRERRVVPLLGAGVSAGSVDTTAKLMGTLKAALKSADGHDRFHADDAGNGDFARLAEILHWQGQGAEQICDALDIRKWADIAPTRAHRYLALLACEGLITDIVTTNYDCGLETAWRQARGPRLKNWHAIASAEDLSRPRPRQGNAHLNVYKINGCAGRLAKGAPERATEIMLTDRQLQQFGQRRWAGDLIRVLLRERLIIFSGFGSEEPQVWHVVQDILGEFSSRPKPDSSGDPYNRTLWTAQYKKQIGFYVLQALVAENRARRCNSPLEFPSVFSGDDAEFFGSSLSILDAGFFWRRIWVEGIRAELENTNGPVAHAFVGHILGQRCRSEREKDKLLLGVWKDIVGQVFKQPQTTGTPRKKFKAPRWLAEPAEWRNKSRRKDALCAPAALCVTDDSGREAQQRYLTLHEEPEYWFKLIVMALLCTPDSQVCTPDPRNIRLGAVWINFEPEIKITIGSHEIVTYYSRIDRNEILYDRIGEKKERLHLKTSSQFLNFLDLPSMNNITVDILQTKIFDYINRSLLHESRENQKKDRDDRRERVAAGTS